MEIETVKAELSALVIRRQHLIASAGKICAWIKDLGPTEHRAAATCLRELDKLEARFLDIDDRCVKLSSELPEDQRLAEPSEFSCFFDVSLAIRLQFSQFSSEGSSVLASPSAAADPLPSTRRLASPSAPSPGVSPDCAVGPLIASGGVVSHQSPSLSSSPDACRYCAVHGHTIRQCPSFKALTARQRRQFAVTSGICRNCMSAYHRTSDCRSSQSCYSCGRRHHTILHPRGDDTSRGTSRAPPSSRSVASPSPGPSSSVATLRVPPASPSVGLSPPGPSASSRRSASFSDSDLSAASQDLEAQRRRYAVRHSIRGRSRVD